MRILAAPARAQADDNPYVDLLYGPMRASGATVDDWSRAAVARGRYDVIHVHWPEFLVRDGQWSAPFDTIKVLALIWWARRRGAVLIWTGHDLEPHHHTSSRVLRAYQRLFVAQVDGLLTLDRSSLERLRRRWPALTQVPVAVVPHGHYRDSNPPLDASRPVARRRLGLPATGAIYLAFGQVREYKNLDALVRAFVADRQPQETLLVAGRCADDELRRRLHAVATADVVLWLDGVRQDDVSAVFRASDVAVQCYHERSALNSGVQLLALSCELPTVTTASATADAISRIVGPGWIVQTIDDPRSVVRTARRVAQHGPPASPPDLSHLEWSGLSSRTVDHYHAVMNARTTRRFGWVRR